ncbi:hypothetical protein [Pseudomonas aeruginosa]
MQPFDLERGPLLRVNLLQLAEDDHVLVLVSTTSCPMVGRCR